MIALNYHRESILLDLSLVSGNKEIIVIPKKGIHFSPTREHLNQMTRNVEGIYTQQISLNTAKLKEKVTRWYKNDKGTKDEKCFEPVNHSFTWWRFFGEI